MVVARQRIRQRQGYPGLPNCGGVLQERAVAKVAVRPCWRVSNRYYALAVFKG